MGGDVLLPDALLERADGLAQVVHPHDESCTEECGRDGGGGLLDDDLRLLLSGHLVRVHNTSFRGVRGLIIPPVNPAIKEP